MYSSLRVKTPPTAEPVSLVQAKAHLRVDHNADDVLISSLITTARWLIEGWTARAFVETVFTWTMSQDPPTGSLPLLPMPLLILPVILSAPQVMKKPLELPRSPVSAVNSIIEADTDGTTHTLTAGTDYVVDLAVDPARVRLQWLTMPRYLQHLQVEFVAGFAANDLPAPLVHAIKLMIAFLYERRGDDEGTLPKVIDYLIAPYRVMYFGG